MDPARHPRAKKKDRSGMWISIGAHVGLIVIALIILSQTELGRQLKDNLLGTTRAKDRTDKPKPPPPEAPRPKGPKAPVDAPPPPASRGHVDAPPPTEGGFAVDSGPKAKGPATASGADTNKQLRVAPPPPKPVAVRPVFQSASTPSTVAALLVQRSKAAASIESIGSEQFSKAGAGDAGAIIKNISGATVTDGKFAVIRGLNDRYISTTL